MQMCESSCPLWFLVFFVLQKIGYEEHYEPQRARRFAEEFNVKISKLGN
jgi:hypothetical protein